MLSIPSHGWCEFKLNDTSIYGLSYVTNVPFDWVEAAIHGLQTNHPFCVSGSFEPGHFLCTVSYSVCFIVTEEYTSVGMRYTHETGNMDRLQFCQHLYDDISQNIDAWVDFSSFGLSKSEKRKLKRKLVRKLECLKELISKRAQ